MTEKFGRILWIVAIVAMGLTAAMNLLGGSGTVCAAFLTKNFPPMWRDLQHHTWLYQRVMIMTIIIGIAGIWSTYSLFRSKEHAYRDAMALLLIGTLLAELQMVASLNLRGKAVPANVKFYLNLFTLIYFLVLRLPSLYRMVDFPRPASQSDMVAAGGLTATIAGITVLTVNFWVGSSHVYQGVNWIDPFQSYLTIIGLVLTLGGLGIFTRAVWKISHYPQAILLTAEAKS